VPEALAALYKEEHASSRFCSRQKLSLGFLNAEAFHSKPQFRAAGMQLERSLNLQGALTFTIPARHGPSGAGAVGKKVRIPLPDGLLQDLLQKTAAGNVFSIHS